MLNCSVPVNFLKWRGGGGHLDHLRGHPDVVPAVALWLTCYHVDYVKWGESGHSRKRGQKKLRQECERTMNFEKVTVGSVRFQTLLFM